MPPWTPPPCSYLASSGRHSSAPSVSPRPPCLTDRKYTHLGAGKLIVGGNASELKSWLQGARLNAWHGTILENVHRSLQATHIRIWRNMHLYLSELTLFLPCWIYILRETMFLYMNRNSNAATQEPCAIQFIWCTKYYFIHATKMHTKIQFRLDHLMLCVHVCNK